MDRKWISLLSASGLAGAGLALLSGPAFPDGGAVYQLWSGLGGGLRRLSLSGWPGNLAAWTVVLALSLLPLLLFLPLKWRGISLIKEDWVLGLTVPLAFVWLFTAVNPTQVSSLLPSAWPAMLTSVLLSTLAAWLALRLVRAMGTAPPERLGGIFGGLLLGLAAFLSFSAVYGGLSGWLTRCETVRAGNTGDPQGAAFTCAVLGVLALVELAPSLLGALTLLWGARLAKTLPDAPFSQSSITLCDQTAARCQQVVQLSVLLTLCANLLQLLLFDRLRDSHFTLYLPLLPLALSAGLLALCRLFRRGKALQDENDSFV